MKTFALARADGGVSIMRVYNPDPAAIARNLAKITAEYAARTPPLVIQTITEIAEADVPAECKRAARTGASVNFRNAAVFSNGKVEIDIPKARQLAKDARAVRGRSKKDIEIDAATDTATLKSIVEGA